MKNILFIITLYITLGCSKILMEKQPTNDPKENFNSLWNVINEKYSFFILKNINWNNVKTKYEPRIKDNMNQIELFYVLSDMLYELRDGHVNLYGGFDISRNWDWYINYPTNFDINVIEESYLGENYLISGGMKISFLRINNIGNYIIYAYYNSFSNTSAYIDFIVNFLKNDYHSKGLILDIRNNGGGNVENAQKIANALADNKRLVLKEYYKNGKGHNDFSEQKNIYLDPKTKPSKPVIILTNRKCYSASSFFCGMVKNIPNVKIMGDTTGGGAGLPIDYELPNKWKYRFSTTKTEFLDNDGIFKDFELGIAPHIVLPTIPRDSFAKGTDTWVEFAIKDILKIEN